MPSKFCLQLLNTMSKYDKEARKIYPNLNPTVSLQQKVKPQSYKLPKRSEVEAHFLHELSNREKFF